MGALNNWVMGSITGLADVKQEVGRACSTNTQLGLRSYSKSSKLFSDIEAGVIEGLHIHLVKVDFSQLDIVIRFRMKFPNIPLIITTSNGSAEAVEILRSVNDVRVLDFKTEIKSLPGLMFKMLNGTSNYHRVQKRFPTKQAAKIVRSRNETDEAVVLDLSKGGAKARSFSVKPLKIGDRVELEVDLSRLGKKYVMDAKVVWEEKETATTSDKYNQIVGLQFIDVSQSVRFPQNLFHLR